jgi:hypothetical protein
MFAHLFYFICFCKSNKKRKRKKKKREDFVFGLILQFFANFNPCPAAQAHISTLECTQAQGSKASYTCARLFHACTQAHSRHTLKHKSLMLKRTLAAPTPIGKPVHLCATHCFTSSSARTQYAAPLTDQRIYT